MEFVYVIKRSDLFDLSYPQGFQPLHVKELEKNYLSKIREKGFFLERKFAEQDSSFKQIIPYCMVEQEDKILLLRRLSGQGENRLHNKLSIGVGGHINPQDSDEGDVLQQGSLRELEEELILEGDYQIEPIGIINDDSTEVGSVHFGLVQRISLHKGSAQIREKDLMEGSFNTRDELKKLMSEGKNFESWSQFLIQQLDKINNQPLTIA